MVAGSPNQQSEKTHGRFLKSWHPSWVNNANTHSRTPTESVSKSSHVSATMKQRGFKCDLRCKRRLSQRPS